MPATAAQLIANRENATHSTGPRTEEGKSKSSRNAIKLGLFTAHDFVLPEERQQYEAICAAFWQELYPIGALEETHVLEIIHASWRLQRCSKIEADLVDAALENALNGTALDPMQNEAALRTQNAIDRARTQANNTLRRATAELRRLQTNREIGYVTVEEGINLGLSDRRQVTAALHADEKAKMTVRKANGLDSFEKLLVNADQVVAHNQRCIMNALENDAPAKRTAA